MIDCLFWLDFFLPTYSNSLRFPYFMKLAHRHFFENVVIFFAVLFSFQRTIALSDLIIIACTFPFVKLFFCIFLRKYRQSASIVLSFLFIQYLLYISYGLKYRNEHGKK